MSNKNDSYKNVCIILNIVLQGPFFFLFFFVVPIFLKQLRKSVKTDWQMLYR